MDVDCTSNEPISVGFCAFTDPAPGAYQIRVESGTGGGAVQVTSTLVSDDDKGDRLGGSAAGCATTGAVASATPWLVFLLALRLTCRRRSGSGERSC